VARFRSRDRHRVDPCKRQPRGDERAQVGVIRGERRPFTWTVRRNFGLSVDHSGINRDRVSEAGLIGILSVEWPEPQIETLDAPVTDDGQQAA
jgi:hypothetical protein